MWAIHNSSDNLAQVTVFNEVITCAGPQIIIVYKPSICGVAPT